MDAPSNTVTRDSLIGRFTLFEFNSETINRQIAQRVSKYRQALDKQSDVLPGEMPPGDLATAHQCRLQLGVTR